MKDLTKEELLQIVKESNKDILDEFGGYAAQAGVAKRAALDKYADFISQVRFILLDNMLEQVKADYRRTLSKSDIEHLISKECNERLMRIVGTLTESLSDMIGGGHEEEGESTPIPLPPSRTQE